MKNTMSKTYKGEYMIVESLEPNELRMPHLNLKELQECKDRYLNSIKKKEDDIAQIQFSISEDKTELGWIERDIKIRCQIPDFEEWKRDFKEKARLLDALNVLYEYCRERCGKPDTRCRAVCCFWDKTANECRIGSDETGPITEWLFKLKEEMYDK